MMKQGMKKAAAGILAAAMALSVGVALAAGPGSGRHFANAGGCGHAGRACRYADGACGNRAGYGACGYGANFTDADGDGICDNRAGYGVNFTDADGDGICDNWATGRAGGCCGGRNQ